MAPLLLRSFGERVGSELPSIAASGRAWVAAMGLCATLAAGLYLITAPRTITWAHGGADGPELAAVAYILGVAHPTGYPLYTLLGHLFTHLPVGEVAFRMALFSLTCAVAAIALVVSTIRFLSIDGAAGSLAGAVAAGLGLGVAPLFWSQANITEVYGLHMALMAGALLLLAAWRPGRDGVLRALGLVVGLGFAHHVTFVFLAGAAGLYILVRDPQVMRRPVLFSAVGGVVLGLGLYLYIPLRASAEPDLNWGNAVDLGGLIDHVSGRAYRGYVLSRPGEAVLQRIPAMARIIGEQFTWPGLAIAALGLIQLCRRTPALGATILGITTLNLIFALIYNAAGGQVYLLPGVLVLALGFGLGVSALVHDLGARIVAPVVLVLLGWQLLSYWPEMNLAGDQQAAVYARETLDRTEPGGFVRGRSDEETFSLWYAQLVEGRRRDVAVIDERLIYAPWYREQLQRRYPEALSASGL